MRDNIPDLLRSTVSSNLGQYGIITANYWAFTLTDGALRMLVVLYFYDLGYSTLAIATLFLLYELFGVITNLVGGYLGARFGLNRTMHVGLFLQIIALTMLMLPNDLLSIAWVMFAQAISGIAKDLNKMSAKSAIKSLARITQKSHQATLDDVTIHEQGRLFRWVAVLTGSKNTLKGIGFFLGGALLMVTSFQGAVAIMAACLVLMWFASLMLLTKDLGQSTSKPKVAHLFAKSPSINWLSLARMFLFGARDVWFVVALPVYLSQEVQWSDWQVGTTLAVWIIGYGFVQSTSPWLLRRLSYRFSGNHKARAQTYEPTCRTPFIWVLSLTAIPLVTTLAMGAWDDSQGDAAIVILLLGIGIFGIVFAINSAIHSFLIVDLARAQGTSLDVGFYYMANAAGRLIGTLLSGMVFLYGGMAWCLLVSSMMLFAASLASLQLAKVQAFH